MFDKFLSVNFYTEKYLSKLRIVFTVYGYLLLEFSNFLHLQDSF